nr:hypothetical protein [Tanacetum cinerariifolium]
MHKAFPLLEESSYWQCNFPLPVEGVPTARRMEIPLPKSLHCYDEETASQRELAVTLRRWLMKLEKLIIEGKVTIVDDDGKPLKKVDYPRNHDSNDEDLPDKLQDICDNLDIRVRDINECEVPRTCPCYGIYNNTPEGYNCNCLQGAIEDGK